jgi:DNA-binding NarL/FixJ family response regulator
MRVLMHVVEGESNPEIASALGLQPKTVRNVVSSILSKLGARSRTQAAVIAIRSNLLEDDPLPTAMPHH